MRWSVGAARDTSIVAGETSSGLELKQGREFVPRSACDGTNKVISQHRINPSLVDAGFTMRKLFLLFPPRRFLDPRPPVVPRDRDRDRELTRDGIEFAAFDESRRTLLLRAQLIARSPVMGTRFYARCPKRVLTRTRTINQPYIYSYGAVRLLSLDPLTRRTRSRYTRAAYVHRFTGGRGERGVRTGRCWV